MRSDEFARLEAEAEALEYELALGELRDACQSSFETFVRTVAPDYKMTWVHQLIAKEVETLEKQDDGRLMLSMPPRHGKSRLVSHLFPAWLLARSPHTGIVAASYNETAASTNNRAVQRVMDTEIYREVFPGSHLPDSNVRTLAGAPLRNSDIFEMPGARGGYMSSGVEGTFTGRGGRALLADDVIKNDKEAGSPVARANLWEWWHNTFTTRLTGGRGFIVLIMTRWHELDIAGALLDKAMNDGGEQWKTIVLPLVRDLEDVGERPYDLRPLNAALCPELGYDEAWAAKKKTESTVSSWNGLQQQRPSALEGNVIKTASLRFWYLPNLPPPPAYRIIVEGQEVAVPQETLPEVFRRKLSSWDATFTKSADSDYVVGTMWGADSPACPAKAWLLDLWRQKATVKDTMDALQAMHAKHPDAREHVMEAAANGHAVVSLVENSVPGLILVRPDGGKMARAQAAAVNFDAGNVILPHPSLFPWVLPLIRELTTFPKGANDDQMDSVSQALNRLYGVRAWKIY